MSSQIRSPNKQDRIHCPNCGSIDIQAEAQYSIERDAGSTDFQYQDSTITGRCFASRCHAKFTITISTPLDYLGDQFRDHTLELKNKGSLVPELDG